GQTTNLESIFAGINLGWSQINLASVFSDIAPENIHQAINYALKRIGVIVTPAAGSAWTVSQKMFDRMIDLVLEKLIELDPVSARAVTRLEMAKYLVERGYKTSEVVPDPIIKPAVPPPVIVDKGPDDIHAAINYALGTVGVVVTIAAGNRRHVSQSKFNRMIDLALQRLNQLNPAVAGTMSRRIMAKMIVERGYTNSTLPERIEPAVIVEPPIFIPKIHKEVVESFTEPEPLYDPDTFSQRPKPAEPVFDPDAYVGGQRPTEEYVSPPEDYPLLPDPGIPPTYDYDTVPRKKTDEGIDRNAVYWIVGALVGGFILSGMGRGRDAY
ncbi:MAG: hypothetical protein KAJ19_08795, partial [Gammaproteobacteria bacterium]|nr:hypothetical protein [Gammaproteobacteria bacterium]